jgi:cysteine desulfurase
VGFLAIPASLPRLQQAAGGPQESGRRAGTENLPGILAMIAALKDKPDRDLEAAAPARAANRNAFEARIREILPGTRVVGAEADRLWNTSMLILPRHANLKWLTRLSQLGFPVSTGAACSAGRGNPSHVMEAMGLDGGEMGRVLRISGGWDTTAGDWAALADAIAQVWADLESGRRPPSILAG